MLFVVEVLLHLFHQIGKSFRALAYRRDKMSQKKNPTVFLDVSINGGSPGRMTFEVYFISAVS